MTLNAIRLAATRIYTSLSDWGPSLLRRLLTKPVALFRLVRYTRFIFAFLLYLRPFLVRGVPRGRRIMACFSTRTAGVVQDFAFPLLGRSGAGIEFVGLCGLSSLHVGFMAGFLVGID